MNARYDAEYERTFDANNPIDYIHYIGFLFAYDYYQPSATQKKLAQTRKPTQKEEVWWYSKEGLFWFSSSSAPKLVSKLLLQTTRTKARSRKKEHGAGRRKQKDEGDIKGSRQVAVQRLRKDNQSNRKQDSYGIRWN